MASLVKWHKGVAACDCGEKTPLEYSSCGDFMVTEGWERGKAGEYMCKKCSLAVRGIEKKLTGAKRIRKKQGTTGITSESTMHLSGVFWNYLYGDASPLGASINFTTNRKRPYHVVLAGVGSTDREGIRKYIRFLQRALREL